MTWQLIGNIGGPAGRDGIDGKSIDIDDIATRAAALVPSPKDGLDGKDAAFNVESAEAMVKSAVAEAIAQLPPANDGRDGRDGESVSVDVVRDLIATEVKSAIATIQIPKDGQSVTAEDISPLIVQEVQKAVSALPVAKDGVGVVATLVDRDGHLVLTMSDGSTKDVGPVIGRDGADVDWAAVERRIADELAKWPKPKDGKDGLGFEDFEEEFDGERTLIRRYRRGDEVKEFRHTFPIVIDRGVYQPGRTYEKGDGVTWAGSFWIAQEATSAKPGEPGMQSRAWRLAVKKGTDGKTGPAGPLGPQGIKGDVGPMGPARY